MRIEGGRSPALAVLVIAAFAAIVARAPGSETIRPAKNPALLNPKGQPRGGSPVPDELSWDAPESCDSERFRGRGGNEAPEGIRRALVASSGDLGLRL